MKVLALTLALATMVGMSTSAQAHDDPRKTSECYLFKKDKVLSKGRCTVDSGAGAGGSWTTISFRGKKYHFEYIDEIESPNNQEQTSYIRDSKILKIIKNPQNMTAEQADNLLFCDISGSQHICYKSA
ncbi:hypothetical protein LU293_00280 [Moraxella nasovis]|uniref:hypothetical protein n=1 Tax=Moraxella nasovis TaxID=2904121 RepID=UPI001F6178E9|nr:hypothetical protein [Moraxella nasovis]UNU73390.1 hypothetical protein LU293_00280 [Moraxella nasovis]